MDRQLRQRIVQFLETHIGNNERARSALLEAALHGCGVLGQIGRLDKARSIFTSHLVEVLANYGQCDGNAEPALVVLLRHIGSQQGVDVRDQAHALCEELLQVGHGDAAVSLEVPVLPPPSPNPRMRDHIFISYSHHDRTFVDQLAEDLR